MVTAASLRSRLDGEEEAAGIHSGQPVGVEAAAALEIDLGAVEAATTRRKMTVLDLAHELLERILHRGPPSRSAKNTASPRSPPPDPLSCGG
jgi:hypothetical protein